MMTTAEPQHPTEPLGLIHHYLTEAARRESFDASRCALATADAHGVPSVRFVLVKAVDATGVVFHTNYESRKAKQMGENPNAALAFHWAELGIQVRVEGDVARLSAEESDAYFATRARGSQLGAWASRQSAPLASRKALKTRIQHAEKRFEHNNVSRPPFWGGYRVCAQRVEFWYNRDDRLHERVEYISRGPRDQREWRMTCLQP